MDVKSPYLEDSFIMDGPPLIYHMIRTGYDYSPLCGAASKITTGSTTRVTCENCLRTMRGKETIVAQVHYTRSQIDDMMANLTKVIAENRETDNLAQNRLLQEHIAEFIEYKDNHRVAHENLRITLKSFQEQIHTLDERYSELVNTTARIEDTTELARQTANINARLDDIAGPAKETEQVHELVKLILDGTYIWTCSCGDEVDTGYFGPTSAMEDFLGHAETHNS